MYDNRPKLNKNIAGQINHFNEQLPKLSSFKHSYNWKAYTGTCSSCLAAILHFWSNMTLVKKKIKIMHKRSSHVHSKPVQRTENIFRKKAVVQLSSTWGLEWAWGCTDVRFRDSLRRHPLISDGVFFFIYFFGYHFHLPLWRTYWICTPSAQMPLTAQRTSLQSTHLNPYSIIKSLNSVFAQASIHDAKRQTSIILNHL